MTTTWKTRVAPALKALFDKDGKKAAAAEFIKSFNKVLYFFQLYYMFIY